MSFMASMFGTEKPVIGMLHLQPLPGDPLYYPGGSVSRVIDAAKRDLEALQSGGVDGTLITNELSMPYEQHVSAVTLAAMGHVTGGYDGPDGLRRDGGGVRPAAAGAGGAGTGRPQTPPRRPASG